MAVVNAVIMLLICIAADAKVLERVLVEEAVEDVNQIDIAAVIIS